MCHLSYTYKYLLGYFTQILIIKEIRFQVKKIQKGKQRSRIEFC